MEMEASKNSCTSPFSISNGTWCMHYPAKTDPSSDMSDPVFRLNLRAFDHIRAFFLICDLLGGIFTLWTFIALLSCAKSRQNFRNQLLLLHLSPVLLILCIHAGTEFAFHVPLKHRVPCKLSNFLLVFNINMVFTHNWSLFVIMAFNLAQRLNMKPRLPTNAFGRKIVKAVFFLTISIAGVVIILPPLVHYGRLFREHDSEFDTACLEVSSELYRVIQGLTLIFPLSLAMAVLLVTALVRLTNFRRRFSRMEELVEPEITDESPHTTDGMLAYSMATSLQFFINSLTMFGVYWMSLYNHEGVEFLQLCSRLHQVAVIISPLPWLILPDVRSRVRDFRPWPTSRVNTSAIVRYQAEDSQETV